MELRVCYDFLFIYEQTQLDEDAITSEPSILIYYGPINLIVKWDENLKNSSVDVIPISAYVCSANFTVVNARYSVNFSYCCLFKDDVLFNAVVND